MRKRLAKILATLGPASRAPSMMRLLHDAGVDAFRLNFSHGSHEDHGASKARSYVAGRLKTAKLSCATVKRLKLRWAQMMEIKTISSCRTPN